MAELAELAELTKIPKGGKTMFEFIRKWCKKEERKEENNMFKTYETELAGRKLVLETGKIAGLANRKCIS